MNIYLIGFRCSGKTSVGTGLASAWRRHFIDTDRAIVTAEGASIAEMVARRGWEHFRGLEREVIRRVAADQRLVVATGGGAVIDPTNVERMRASGTVVWLRVAAVTVQSRMQRDPRSHELRPSLTGKGAVDEIEVVLERRNRLYAAAADITLDTDRLPVPVAVRLIQKHLRGMNGEA
jgi:shikimate kinase